MTAQVRPYDKKINYCLPREYVFFNTQQPSIGRTTLSRINKRREIWKKMLGIPEDLQWQLKPTSLEGI